MENMLLRGCHIRPKLPEGVGAEMKALACGETGIILKLDMMEGREANRRKDFSQEYGEGTAVTLRLTKEYYGTGRVVHADSAFSSVKTLLALRERGLFFMCMIKTAHKELSSNHGPMVMKREESHQEGIIVCCKPNHSMVCRFMP